MNLAVDPILVNKSENYISTISFDDAFPIPVTWTKLQLLWTEYCFRGFQTELNSINFTTIDKRVLQLMFIYFVGTDVSTVFNNI